MFYFICGSKLPRSNSKASATISTPPLVKVLGGPREIANISDCGLSVVANAYEECTMIDTVPGSSVKKDIEKPSCSPSESVSPLAGDHAELFNEFLAFMNFRGAPLDKRSASKLPVDPTRPSSTIYRKGPATAFQ